MDQNTAITTTPATTRELDLFDAGQFAGAMKLAELLSTATGWVPRHLLGNPGACFGIVSLAKAWNVNPFLLAAGTADVHGKLLFEAKAVQAGIERSGALTGRLSFRMIGDWSQIRNKFRMVTGRNDKDGKPTSYAQPAWDAAAEKGLAVEVSGTPAGDTEPATDVTYLEACHPRNSTLWATDPETQCRYRATRNWARKCLPAVMLGAVTQDEYAGEVVIDVTPQAPAPSPKSRLTRKETPAAAETAKPEPAAATIEPAAFDPGAVPVKAESALAALKAHGVESEWAIRFAIGTQRTTVERGFAGCSQEFLAECYSNPGKVAKIVSRWTDEQDQRANIEAEAAQQ